MLTNSTLVQLTLTSYRGPPIFCLIDAYGISGNFILVFSGHSRALQIGNLGHIHLVIDQ